MLTSPLTEESHWKTCQKRLKRQRLELAFGEFLDEIPHHCGGETEPQCFAVNLGVSE
jgi:hypothetical protein